MFKVDADLRSCTRSHSSLRVLSAAIDRMSRGRMSLPDDMVLAEFGRWLERGINASQFDIMDCLTGPGPGVGRVLHNAGKPWICNRGSVHILTQRDILEQEWRKWDGPQEVITEANVERSLQEYEEADAIAVPSDFVRQSFLDRGVSKEKLHVCPYGVDLTMFRKERKEDGVFRVVFVSSACRQKGFGYLLEALAPLVEKKIVEFWMVGAIHVDVAHLAEKYAHTFIFKGYIPRNQLSWYYSQASVFVHPSVQEGLSLVLAQAMACGLPVVATRNTGASNLYTDGVEGFIIPARDSTIIREKVLQLVEDPLLRDSMAEAALKRVQSLGGWRAYGQSCLDMYRHVLHAYSSAT